MSVDSYNCHNESDAYWDEQVGNFILITLPSIAIFPSASFDISHRAVCDHNHEENEIKPGKWTPNS